ncbi:unnamed protein product [Brachionus calyciflorus]|uniref:Uncharacterized protein n=1 Tax=Brachionus calyciflorus TaxID=104777 RepID=A0A813U9H6_9BILA|nr:unnamed protein product [Brachionus calyciflorus]
MKNFNLTIYCIYVIIFTFNLSMMMASSSNSLYSNELQADREKMDKLGKMDILIENLNCQKRTIQTKLRVNEEYKTHFVDNFNKVKRLDGEIDSSRANNIVIEKEIEKIEGEYNEFTKNNRKIVDCSPFQETQAVTEEKNDSNKIHKYSCSIVILFSLLAFKGLYIFF